MLVSTTTFIVGILVAFVIGLIIDVDSFAGGIFDHDVHHHH